MKRATEITAPGFLPPQRVPGPSVQGLPCTPFLTARKPFRRPALHPVVQPTRGSASLIAFGDTGRSSGFRRTLHDDVAGPVFYGLTGISSSDVREFTSSIANGVLVQLPNIVAPGTAYGKPGLRLLRRRGSTYKDPYSYQWNLSSGPGVGAGLRCLYRPLAPDALGSRPQPAPSTVPYSAR
jgi:hypothetical protein